MTSTGLIIGSCAYMAAERFAGGQVGPAADIYSLTCLLYECLTGRAPFETGGDLRQLMSAHMFSPPPRPSIMRRGITRAFDDVIARGMAKKPTDRYAYGGRAGQGGERGRGCGRAAAAAASSRRARRSSTRQFSAVYENPAGPGYTPYPVQLHAPRRRRRGRGASADTQVALAAAAIVLFGVAAVLASLLISGGRDSSPSPRTTLAAPPR